VSKGLACLFFIFISTAFQPVEHQTTLLSDAEENGKRLVTLHSDEFKAFTNRVYKQLEYPIGYDTISEDVLSLALRGYMYLKHTQELKSEKYLTVVDFSKYCNHKRMWVIDMESKKIIFNELVAHGAKSGDTYAKYFSNTHSSNKSSLGFYTTGGLYNGSNNLSLKLNGLEKNFNSNAFTRGIVIHGANYVNERIVNDKQRIGRSYGCPAVSQEVNEILVNTIQGGNCLFIYHPTPSYLEKSKLVNANLYITVDDLNI
jgi:hypothetical protein